MKNKLFLATLAMSLAVPAVVVTSELPVNAEDNKNVIKGFKDLPKTHWAYNDVMEMTKQGIIYGYTDGTFRPNESISRLHVAMMIERAKDLKPIREGKEFKDVPKTHKYYQSVQNVYRAGIFDGKTSDTFGIDDKLTRAEMARVLVNTFEMELVSGYIFKDVYADHWAKDYIATVYQYGVAFGDTNGKYSPQAPVTRAEYSAFLYRALNLDKDFKPENPLKPTPPTKPEEPKPEKPKPEPGAGLGFITDQYTKPSQVPTPPGYVAGKHEEQREAEFQKIGKDRGESRGVLEAGIVQPMHNPGSNNGKSDYERYAKEVGMTYAEFKQVIDNAVKTGKMYDGEKLTVYYKYTTGTAKIRFF